MLRRSMFTLPATLIVLVTGVGATSTAAPDGTVNLYLPSVLSPAIPLPPEETCRLFADDFSDPSSGWPIGDWPTYSTRYDANQYRVLHHVRTQSLSAHPAIDWPTNEFSASADIRWEDSLGSTYGFYLTTVESTGRFSYQISISPLLQKFAVVKWSGGLPETIFPGTTSYAINPGNATNRVKITKMGNEMTFSVNGTVVATFPIDDRDYFLQFFVDTFGPYGSIPAAARYDNFCADTVVP